MRAFEALVVDKQGNQVDARVRTMNEQDLPEGDLLIKVAYSSLNYKDALACTANGNIVRHYPFVPGIDLAGTVVTAGGPDSRFREGDEVLVTGYGLGVSHYGGFSEYARVPSAWAVPLPQGLSALDAMIIGTAGFTAALSVFALQDSGVRPDSGTVLVTGASGGVGTMAVAMLARLGYEVEASSGKADMANALLELGAKRILRREELIPEQPRPLSEQRWAGAIDCVGGRTLSSILAAIRYGGAVAASGLTGGTELSATVFPFILRGIRLIGIDSVQTPMDIRLRVWDRLAAELMPPSLSTMYRTVSLEQIPSLVPSILQGESRGRLVVQPWRDER